jgi:hypothetical protein
MLGWAGLDSFVCQLVDGIRRQALHLAYDHASWYADRLLRSH